MSKKLIMLLLALMLAAGAAVSRAEIAVTDMFDREIILSEPVTRVVALSAAECEIICALGCENVLVGRGAYCNYPETIGDVPVVQSGAETNIEEIIALKPQIVIMTDMAQDLGQVNQLEACGIQVVSTRNTNIEGAYDAISMIGALLGRDTEAKAIIADMKSTFDEIRANTDATHKTVYFEVSPLAFGLWTAGKSTFMDEIAQICGLSNAFSDLEGWKMISEEQVIERNPDYIVSTAGMIDGDKEIMSRGGWKGIEAVKNGNVLNADADMITRPGPRLKDAAISLYRFFYDIDDTKTMESEKIPAA